MTKRTTDRLRKVKMLVNTDDDLTPTDKITKNKKEELQEIFVCK